MAMTSRRFTPSPLLFAAAAAAAFLSTCSPCLAFSSPPSTVSSTFVTRFVPLSPDALLAPSGGRRSHPAEARLCIRGVSAAFLTPPAGAQLRMSQSDEEVDEGGFFSSVSTPLDNPFLAFVDLLSFLAFAAVGKASHDSDGSIDLAAVFVTAFPFLLSWYITAPLLGCYDPQSTARGVGSAVKVAAKGWIVAVPLGCVLRGVIKGYVPPAPFVIVTMISTLVILGAARAGYSKIQTEIFS